MAAQPSDADIEQMVMMSGITRDEAIRRLRGNNNDLNLALNELFDDPDNTRYKWEEGAFSSDRDGTPNSAGIAFQVQGPDDPGTSGFYSAPSRPPSRSSNKSPLGRIISLADEHAAADPRNALSQDEIGDIDLQRALAESAEEAGLPPQQYGVTDGSQMVHFGPANRTTYDENQWGIVLRSSSAQEVLPDPDVADRKREDGAPAFLKPSVEDYRLASILTVYHEIPLAREIFLNRKNLLPDYGHDPEWWMGKTIKSRTAAITDTSDSNLAQPTPEDCDEFIREIQRLMAFLDRTDRSYGSAEALTDMTALKQADANDVDQKFFEAWRQIYTKSDENSTVSSLFTEAVQPSVDGSPLQSKHFAILELDLPYLDNTEEMETLYDIADQALWSMSGPDVRNRAYLKHLGDVIAFRMGGNGECKNVKIPATWYPDRYIEDNIEASLDMWNKKAAIREGMQKLRSLEHKLTYYTLPSGNTIKVKDLFDASLMHDTNTISYNSVNDMNSDSYDTELASGPKSVDGMNLSGELQSLMKSIDKKLKALEGEREKARDSLRELSKLYTELSAEPSRTPTLKYTLRGVSTTNYVTYVRKRAEPDLIDMDIDTEESKKDIDQWWKIEYSMSGSRPLDVTKVTENEVLLAAYRDSKYCVIIYASEKAMAEPHHPLPDPLENFVRADNLAFSAEFPMNHELLDSSTQTTSPRSPPKRKFDESSENSSVGDTSQIRWGGMSPPPPYRAEGNITDHHAQPGFAEPQPSDWDATINDAAIGHNRHDIIMGQDPNESDAETIGAKGGKEMKEMEAKAGMPTLIPGLIRSPAKKTGTGGDGMDVDDLVSLNMERS